MIAGLGQASALVSSSVLSDQNELREKRDLLEKRLKVIDLKLQTDLATSSFDYLRSKNREYRGKTAILSLA